MEDQIINFGTAKLAKEKGLISGLSVEGVYNIGWNSLESSPDFIKSPRNTVEGQFHLALAPTQSLLQKWLRDDPKIMVWCIPVGRSDGDYIIWDYNLYDHSKPSYNLIEGKCALPYEEALEEGLREALKLIK